MKLSLAGGPLDGREARVHHGFDCTLYTVTSEIWSIAGVNFAASIVSFVSTLERLRWVFSFSKNSID